MYKVFINGNLLIITRHPVKHVPGFKKIIFETFERGETFKRLLEIFEKEQIEKFCYCVHDPDLALMWKKFRKNFTLVTAAGGLVRNEKNKILFIYRNGKWDLPKGKAELHETMEEAAIREVKEECAIKNVILTAPITETYHTYGGQMNKKLKKTFWFRMYSEDKELVPQTAEGITKIKWMKEEKLEKVLRNTYPSIMEVIHAELNKEPEQEGRVWDKMVNFE